MTTASPAAAVQTSPSPSDAQPPAWGSFAGNEADLLGLLDQPQEWSVFSRALAERVNCWESNLLVEGMHCSACAFTIEDALLRVPGVLQADVSAASQRARVVWRSDLVQPSTWMRAVLAAGYRAVPANDAFAREQRRNEARQALWRLAVAGLCMMQVMMYAFPAYVATPADMTPEIQRLLRWASWVLSLPVMFFSCPPFFNSALRDLRQRRISMDLPVALGMLVTFGVSTVGTFEPQGNFGREVYFDSLTMFVFFLLAGRWLELRLRDQTAGALEAVVNRLPDSVERQRPDAGFERVPLRCLVVGDLIRVYPGEAFPADGSVVEGETLVDEALLTGESKPVARTLASQVIAGSHNLSSLVLVRVEQVAEQTRFAQIVALMQSAATTKPTLARLADRIAKPFLVAVLVAAALSCALWWGRDPGHALMVAVAVLVVTCPCALSLATPVAVLAAAGALARRGVMVRRLDAFEALAGIDSVIFDKTGTLTRDALVLVATRVRPGVTQAQALAMAAALARCSLHPVSKALLAAANGPGAAAWVANSVQELAGAGLRGLVGPVGQAQAGHPMSLGSAQFCDVAVVPCDAVQTHLCDEQGWLASFEFHEDLRSDALQAVAALQAAGLSVHLVSGDAMAAVTRVAAQLAIADCHGACSPMEKLEFLRQAQKQGRRVAVVGDGINDGPVLAGAHVSFAFGQAVPLAQAQADFVILGEQLGALLTCFQTARKTLRVVRQNLCWAAGYNALCVPLALLGWLPAWLAGLGMALSSLLVLLNARRLVLIPP